MDVLGLILKTRAAKGDHVPKKRIIWIAVIAAVLTLVFTIPVFATGCDDDTAAYNNRMAGQMMDRGGNADCQDNGMMCQNRADCAGVGDCAGTGNCAGGGNCDGNGGGANCLGGGNCDGANCAGAGAGDCDGTCKGDCATTSNEVICF
jgi:hypothetical protein